jgi:DNA-binding response OmpR family regulator
MILNALLLARDPELVALMRRLFDDLGIRLETMASCKAATECLARRKFEAVLLDCDHMDGARDMVKKVRTMPSNKTSVLFAIVHNTTPVRAAFEMGANFVWERPVTQERAQRCLKAAHALMARERRRAFRHGIDSSVFLQIVDGPEVRARGLNLSEGGMAVWLEREKLRPGTAVQLRFLLPESDVWMQAKSSVVWVSPQGHVGLQFLTVSAGLRLELAQWLTARPEIRRLATA